jgi:hypothetical protein
VLRHLATRAGDERSSSLAPPKQRPVARANGGGEGEGEGYVRVGAVEECSCLPVRGRDKSNTFFLKKPKGPVLP